MSKKKSVRTRFAIYSVAKSLNLTGLDPPSPFGRKSQHPLLLPSETLNRRVNRPERGAAINWLAAKPTEDRCGGPEENCVLAKPVEAQSDGKHRHDAQAKVPV